jgi:predicted MFS family arabinose efflux permease
MTAAPHRSGPSLPVIIVVASTIVAISMGLRQCFGLFQASVTQDLAVSASGFGFALALHNLVWGLSQPVLGALGDRFGPRPVLLGSALVYTAGLLLLAVSDSGVLGLDIGVGILTGIGTAGTGFGVLLGAVSRAAPPERRSQLVGLVSGVGSVGVLGLAPLGQQIIQQADWRVAALTYAAICLSIVALALLVGGRPAPQAASAAPSPGIGAAAREALSHGGFVAMTLAFFACGFQLQFITAHLPRFLGLCGIAPSVGATALGLIGLCNAVGSYAFGVAGARYSRRKLLAAIYAVRTVTIAVYIALPITEASTLVFAAVMGFTWLGVVPLVSGLIGRMFGLAHFNMLFGLVFLCHQLGGFLGPWMGGIVLDMSGGYDLAWYALIAIGALATLLQWPMDDTPRAQVSLAKC